MTKVNRGVWVLAVSVIVWLAAAQFAPAGWYGRYRARRTRPVPRQPARTVPANPYNAHHRFQITTGSIRATRVLFTRAISMKCATPLATAGSAAPPGKPPALPALPRSQVGVCAHRAHPRPPKDLTRLCRQPTDA